MVKSVTVINPKGDALKLVLGEPEKTGLVVQKIEGLGPSKVTINSSQLATKDGSVFSSARATQRNIVFTLAMLLAPTIEDARQKTYRYFPLKNKVRMIIETDNRLVETLGVVEANEPDIFSPRETTQISIICDDPYLYDAGGSSVAFQGVKPNFEFPFSNESLTENLIEFGVISLDSRAIINYKGDADTGLIMTLRPIGGVSNITLYNAQTRESMSIDTGKILAITGKAFDVGDDIVISTVKGDKYARLLRDGRYTNIISTLGKHADWFQITPGDNIFDYTTTPEVGKTNLMITFAYRNAYGGI